MTRIARFLILFLASCVVFPDDAFAQGGVRRHRAAHSPGDADRERGHDDLRSNDNDSGLSQGRGKHKEKDKDKDQRPHL